MKEYKIGFVVTAHYSDEYRPQGGEFLDRFCNSLFEYCTSNFRIYIMDNASTKPLNIPGDSRVTYTRIEDQLLEGITGAWNAGIDKARQDGCDVIINCNDDLWFNETINKFISHIEDDGNIDYLYSVLTDGVLSGQQKSNRPGTGIRPLSCTNDSNLINGFFFGMTKEHYDKYKIDEDKYFDKAGKHNGGDGKWGGQEGQFRVNAEKGLVGIIVNECWLPHTKLRGWKQLKHI